MNDRRWRLKRANISFYDQSCGNDNITRDIPEYDFIQSKFGIKLEHCRIVAEIGCGTASVLLSLPVNEKIGLDISLGNLILAKQRNSRLMLVQADAEYLPFRQNILDAIIIVDLLRHVPNSETVIKEASRVLKRGGKLLVYDACADGVKPIYLLAVMTHKFSQKIGHNIEHFGPTQNDLRTWFTKAGLRIIKRFGEGSFLRYIYSLFAYFLRRFNINLFRFEFFYALGTKLSHIFWKFPIKVGIMAIKENQ